MIIVSLCAYILGYCFIYSNSVFGKLIKWLEKKFIWNDLITTQLNLYVTSVSAAFINLDYHFNAQ